MKYNIVHLNGFMYAVDKTTIKPPLNTWIYQIDIPLDKRPIMRNVNGLHDAWRVVATNDPSLGLPLLPDVEENWFILAKEEWEESKKVMEKMHQPTSQEQQAFFFSGFSFGYKAAKAKQFTEDDMRNAHMTGSISSLNWIKNGIEEEYNHVVKAENYIQSLKPKPIAVELEMKTLYLEEDSNNYTHEKDDISGSKDFLKVDSTNHVNVLKWYYE